MLVGATAQEASVPTRQAVMTRTHSKRSTTVSEVPHQLLELLFVDDERMLREMLKPFLEIRGIRIVGNTGDGREAVLLAEELRPDIMLLDVVLPGINGIDIAAEIHRRRPETGIIMFSAYLESDRIARSLQAGALGYVWKGSDLGELETAIRVVATGRMFVPSVLATDSMLPSRANTKLNAPLFKLTARQREVLQLVAEEKSNKEIAMVLGISVKTVEKHRCSLMNMLDVHNVAGLVRVAVRAGLVA